MPTSSNVLRLAVDIRTWRRVCSAAKVTIYVLLYLSPFASLLPFRGLAYSVTTLLVVLAAIVVFVSSSRAEELQYKVNALHVGRS